MFCVSPSRTRTLTIFTGLITAGLLPTSISAPASAFGQDGSRAASGHVARFDRGGIATDLRADLAAYLSAHGSDEKISADRRERKTAG